MKRLIAVSVLFGYVMLVPFCFYVGYLMASTNSTNTNRTITHQMNGSGLSQDGYQNLVNENTMSKASHPHVSIYNSITHTPLPTRPVMLSILLTILLFAFSLGRFRLVSLQEVKYLRTRKRNIPHSRIRLNILSWLSLFETSPNFA